MAGGILCSGLGASHLGGKEQRLELCQSPRGRQAGTEPFASRLAEQRRWGRQPALAAWHRSPSLSCQAQLRSPRSPSAAVQPRLGPAVPAAVLPFSPAPAGSGRAEEDKELVLRSAVHPQADGEEKGREGTARFWVARRGVGSDARLWRDVRSKVSERGHGLPKPILPLPG